MKGNVLWMREIEARVAEVDPIRGVLKLTLETGVELEVGQEELTAEPLKEEMRKTKKIEGTKREEDKGRTIQETEYIASNQKAINLIN